MPVPRLELQPLPLGPLRPVRPPIVPLEQPHPEVDAVSFGDLVRLVGESIADAQRSLDQASAAMVKELAETKVSVVSGITETIQADGSVTSVSDPAREVSLLELGVLPTFYQFSQSTVEVSMDLKIVETKVENSTTKQQKLFAGTRELRTERKLNRDVTVSSKLTATLVPVPSPLRLDPVRTTVGPV